jgi:hypothetical protein
MAKTAGGIDIVIGAALFTDQSRAAEMRQVLPLDHGGAGGRRRPKGRS